MLCPGGSPQEGVGGDTSPNYTVGELKDWTKRHLFSKTTLIPGGMGGTRVNTPTCKIGTFFLMSLTLTEPSLNNFQFMERKCFQKCFEKKII